MIQVRISADHKDIQKFDMKGHALYAAHGQDVVCAGASAVIIGGMNALDELCRDCCSFIVSENRIQIIVEKSDDSVQLVLSVIEKQLLTIQESYPKHIQITRKEV